MEGKPSALFLEELMSTQQTEGFFFHPLSSTELSKSLLARGLGIGIKTGGIWKKTIFHYLILVLPVFMHALFFKDVLFD